MYDGGNMLHWNNNRMHYKVGGYQSMERLDRSCGGDCGDYIYDPPFEGFGSTYKTFIRRSSMMLVATVEEEGRFYVDGNNGADGSGYVRVDEYASPRWRGFRKSISGAHDPTINHLSCYLIL